MEKMKSAACRSWMGVNFDVNNDGKGVEIMENMNRKEYIDEVIATTVGVEPEAMFYVLERMGSLTGIVKMSNVDDDVLESAIGIDPVAMHQLLNKMDAMIEHPERDPAFAAHVDKLIAGIDSEVIHKLLDDREHMTADPEREPGFAAFVDEMVAGIDQAVIQQLLSQMEPIKNNSERDSVIATYENDLDLWINSQPDLKFVEAQKRTTRSHVA